jgi:hypothetical protein
MLASLGLGALAQLSLVPSALVVFLVKVPRHTIGNLAGLGAGALTATVARTLLGAVVFLLGERFVDRKFGAEGAADPAMKIRSLRLR